MTYRIYTGPCGRCPDCDELTEVRLASVLGEPKTTAWEIHADLLHLIYQGVVRSYGHARIRAKSDADKRKKLKTKNKTFKCLRCTYTATPLHWAEVLDGAVIGPFCKKCLRLALNTLSDDRGLKDDVPIYVVPGRKEILTVAKAALLLRPTATDVDPLPSDDEVVLF
jgi:hypothetical protein